MEPYIIHLIVSQSLQPMWKLGIKKIHVILFMQVIVPLYLDTLMHGNVDRCWLLFFNIFSLYYIPEIIDKL